MNKDTLFKIPRLFRPLFGKKHNKNEVKRDDNAFQIGRNVRKLIGKGDMQILLSSEYAYICRRMSENPEQTISILKKIGEESSEMNEIVKKILRKLSHSKDEVVRTYAFGEL